MEIPTDTYYPKNINTLNNSDCLTILILQGVEVDKSEYQSLASQLTDLGLKVIVPNFFKPGGYLCPDFNSVANFLEYQETLTPGFQESLKDRFVLLGHSAGGIAAFQALLKDSPPLKVNPFAMITYGSNVPKLIELQKNLPPTLIISGTEDSLITPEIAKLGFQNLSGDKNTFLQLSNFDHFSITNSGVPQGYNKANIKLSLCGREATKILAEIINEFILRCVNNSLSKVQNY